MPATTPPQRPPGPQPGSVIRERYRVVREIGHGGLSTVFLGDDLRTSKQVAIKMLSGVDDHMQAVMLRESRLLRQLDSLEGVATVVDVVHENDRLFLIQSFIDGVSLRQWQRGKPAWMVLGLYQRVAYSLSLVHERDIVHRDLKPENVLVSKDKPFIVDFGLAVSSVESDQLTRTMMVGTPVYLSPEAIRGTEVGKAADVFALGVMLFESVAGSPPWPHHSVTGMLTARLRDEPEFRELGPFEAGLGPLLRSMLASDVQARPAADAVSRQIESVLLDVGSLSTRSLPLTPAEPPKATSTVVPVLVSASATALPSPASVLPAPSIIGPRSLVGAVLLAGLFLLGLRAAGVLSIGWFVGFAWLALVGVGLMVLQHSLKQSATKRTLANERLGMSAAVMERIAAVEHQVQKASALTETLAVAIDDLGQRVDPAKLGDVIRNSVVMALQGLDPREAQQSATINRALDLIRDLSGAKDKEKKKSTWDRLSTSSGAIAGVVTMLGGVVGFFGTMNFWRPNAPPAGVELKLDRARITPRGMFVLSATGSDPEGKELEYTYEASVGTIVASGPSAMWTPPTPLTVRLVTFKVTVSDGAASVTKQLAVPVNTRPAGELKVTDTAARNSSVTIVNSAEDADGDQLTYMWTASAGTISGSARVVVWKAPATIGTATITCQINDGFETILLDRVILVR